MCARARGSTARVIVDNCRCIQLSAAFAIESLRKKKRETVGTACLPFVVGCGAVND